MNKKLNDIKWGEFFLDELGNIKSGKDIVKKDMIVGDTPYISATSMNNGINEFVGNNNNSLDSKCISINRTGSVGYAFYHDYEALFSNNCRKFTLNESTNKFVYLFIVNQIKQQKDKYSYGYIMGTGRIKRQKILLPIDDNGNPDFEYMESYIKEKHCCNKEKTIKYIQERLKKLEHKDIPNLTEKNWNDFYINDIFESIQRGKRLTKNNFIKGNTPYISSSGFNNGTDSFIGNKEKVRRYTNCLTLANSGTVGSTFYHPYEFVASDHVTHLKNKKFDKHVYLFLATIIKRMEEKYNFNREINDSRLERELIVLPINNNNEPDYEYMRQYMINHEIKLLKKCLKYLQNEKYL